MRIRNERRNTRSNTHLNVVLLTTSPSKTVVSDIRVDVSSAERRCSIVFNIKCRVVVLQVALCDKLASDDQLTL